MRIHGHTKHDEQPTPTYMSWGLMRGRCLNPKDTNFANYGGRGIRVCERWNSFPLFLEDMGERPRGTTLDRIDDNGHYEPGNCRWATPKEQSNNKRTNRLVTAGGKTLSIAQWAELSGLGWSTISLRLKRGIPADIAVSAPPKRSTGVPPQSALKHVRRAHRCDCGQVAYGNGGKSSHGAMHKRRGDGHRYQTDPQCAT